MVTRCLLQGLYQDVISYEHMIDSAKVKAKELTVQSPRSRVGPLSAQIALNYVRLKDNTKVRRRDDLWQHFTRWHDVG